MVRHGAQGVEQGLPAVVDDHVFAPAQPFQDIGVDLFQALGPGVVGGDDEPIRIGFRLGGHEGALGTVPVATAAEKGDDLRLFGCQLADGTQQLRVSVRSMGVIDEDPPPGCG